MWCSPTSTRSLPAASAWAPRWRAAALPPPTSSTTHPSCSARCRCGGAVALPRRCCAAAAACCCWLPADCWPPGAAVACPAASQLSAPCSPHKQLQTSETQSQLVGRFLEQYQLTPGESAALQARRPGAPRWPCRSTATGAGLRCVLLHGKGGGRRASLGLPLFSRRPASPGLLLPPPVRPPLPVLCSPGEQGEDVGPEFFQALGHVRQIHANCKSLLRTHHQRAGAPRAARPTLPLLLLPWAAAAAALLPCGPCCSRRSWAAMHGMQAAAAGARVQFQRTCPPERSLASPSSSVSAGLELMDSMSALQEGAYERLCR